MTRTEFLKKYIRKIGVAMLVLSLAVYTYYQILGTSSAGIVTTPVKAITDTQKISGEAYLFRREQILTSDAPGVVQTLASDGQKVGKGTAVAAVYGGFSEAELSQKQIRLQELNAEIALLQNSAVPAGTSYSNAVLYREQAAADFLTLRRNLENGDYRQASVASSALLTDWNRYANLTDGAYSVEGLLAELQRERDSLLAGTCQTLYSNASSAYFYGKSAVDGYENIFTEDLAGSPTADALTALKNAPAEVPANAVGKLVFGYEWKTAVILDADSARALTPGDAYTVTFPESRNAEISMTLTGVFEESDRAVAVFTCNRNPADFAYLRVQNAEITVGKTHGLYVPESALETDAEGNVGAFVFESNSAVFRKLEILYAGDGYVIAEEGGELALNDLLITEGRNLYDGRTY